MLQPLRKHGDPAAQAEFQNLYRHLNSVSASGTRIEALLDLIRLALVEIVEKEDGDLTGIVSKIEELGENFELLFGSIILALLRIVDSPGDGLLFIVE